MERRHISGMIIAGTRLGTAIASSLPRLSYPSGRRLGTRRDWIVSDATRTMTGALVGAFVGMVVDLAVNGLPRKCDLQFSLKRLLLAVIAFAIFCFGLNSFVQILGLDP